MPCSFCYYANMACKPIFAFHAIYHFAFLYRILDFTHNLKKNLLYGSSTATFLLPYISKLDSAVLFTNNILTALDAIEMGIRTHCIGGNSINGSPVLSGRGSLWCTEGRLCFSQIFNRRKTQDTNAVFIAQLCI